MTSPSPRRYPELLPLLALIVIAGGIWAFAGLADEVREGETRQIDTRILLALRNPSNHADPLGPPWVEEVERDFTALGGVAMMGLLTFGVCGFLWIDGKRRAVLLVLTAVGGGLLWASVLKHGFERPRPDLVPHGSYVYTSSFPSGHSTMAAATYLTLGALLSRVQRRRRVKAFLLGFAVLITLLVGGQPRLSRSPLADRRAGRVDARRGLGPHLLAARPLAPAPRESGIGRRAAGLIPLRTKSGGFVEWAGLRSS